MGFANLQEGLDAVAATPAARYVLMTAKRYDVPPTAVFMHEEYCVSADPNKHYNNPLSWAAFFGLVPSAIR